MDIKLFEFVVNNIILRDEIYSNYLLKIMNFNKKNNKSTIINISNINFDIEDIEKFKNFNIHIKNNDISYITYHGLKASNNLNKYSNLKEINFKFDRSIQDLYINKLYNLEKIFLPKNKFITNKGIINLEKLKYIDLSSNKNINNASILNKTNLEYLKLINNKKINDDAFINIKELKYLNLGYNNNRKLNLNFLKFNKNIEEVLLFKKKKLPNDVINILRDLKDAVFIGIE